jgi:hypothetical protein
MMKLVVGRVWMLLLGLFTAVAQAAMQEGGEGAYAPEPTVSVVWVVVFLALFLDICVWIGVAIWRNERKNSGQGNKA